MSNQAWDFSGRRPFAELTAEERLMELGRQIVFIKTYGGLAQRRPPAAPEAESS